MKANGVIDSNEVKFLNEILIEFNITESEIEVIYSYDFNQSRAILNNMKNEEIEQAKIIFTGMALCDGYVEPRELEIINSFGGWLIILNQVIELAEKTP